MLAIGREYNAFESLVPRGSRAGIAPTPQRPAPGLRRLGVPMAGVGPVEGDTTLSRLFSSAEELVGFPSGSVGKLFFVQDVKFVRALPGNRLPELAIDSQHRERTGEDNGVALPSVGLQDSE